MNGADKGWKLSQRVGEIDALDPGSGPGEPAEPEAPAGPPAPAGEPAPPPSRTASNASVHQTGTGQRLLTEIERFRFDIAGYLPLGTLLDPAELAEARAAIADPGALPAGVTAAGNGLELELRNIVELGGTLGEVFARPDLHARMVELVWGEQIRLISSRALVRQAGVSGRVTQGGRADPRRFGRYRAFVEGEFRCLLVSVLVALDDTAAGDGAFGVIPASHKANFAHPYADRIAEDLPVLRPLPLAAGEALLYTEGLSYALTAPRADGKRWLLYQYGPSYMLDWPDCTPSAAVREQAASDPVKATLLREPYYH